MLSSYSSLIPSPLAFYSHICFSTKFILKLLDTMPPMGLPGGSDGKESACNAEVLGSIPGSRRSPGEGNG